MISAAHEICQAVLIGIVSPQQWTTYTIVPVPKKGDRSKMTNYRGISLMSIWAKVYNRILLNRIRPVVDQILRNNQAGFRPGRSSTDQINALRRIIEGANRKDLALVLIFVDFKKAFDSINREMLFAILRFYGIPLQVVEAIKQLYKNSKGVVTVNGKKSEPFNINTGVLQGDVLAPFLFVIVIDYIMNRCTCEFGFEFEQRQSSRHPARKLSDLDYADDIALLEQLISIANEQLSKLSREAAAVGLHINTDKTEFIALNQPPSKPVEITLHGKKINRVDDFKYLGSKVISSRADFDHRKSLAWVAFWQMEKMWRAKHVPIRLKTDIFSASVISVLLYGCESWIIDDVMKNKINSFAISCYRIMLGIKRLDKTTNESILQRVNRCDLVNVAYKRQLSWLGHTLRRNENEPSRTLALYEPAPRHGRARPGQPPRTFLQHISSLLTSAPSGLSAKDIQKMAENRKLWRERIADFGI